jgi:hypothetical protein
MASQLTGIVASYQAADTANLNSAKTYSDAAVTTEANARASADSSLATQINTVSATAGAKNRTYRQTTAPTSGMTAGDIWFDSDDNNKAYRYNGTTWELTDDTRIAANTAAIQNEATARATADSAMATQITTLQSSVAGNTATIQTQATVIDGIKAQYMVKTDVNGLVSGFGLYNNGEVSDFFVRADRFAVGNPALLRTGTCSIAGHTTAAACKAAGGTWTWTDANTTNIPFIVYSTQQTINAPDGSGKTLTIEPGVYMKTANIQKAFVGDAEIYGDLKSYSWAASGGPNTFPFNGWKLDKASNLALYGGSFALYDEYGNPIIQAGKIAFSSFRRLIVSASAELFTIAKPPSTAITPSTITLNAVLQNISGTVTWSVTSGTYGAALGTGVQKTIDPAQMTTATVTFKASTTVDSVVYEDYVTLAKVQDGSDSLWLYLSNEAHLVPADAAGVVSSYAGASTIAKVYRGATDVTTSESWAISAASFTGLSGAPDVSGNTVGFADGSPSMTADMATITVRASKSGADPLDRIFTVAKAKQGQSGSGLSLYATSLVRKKFKDGTYEGSYIDVTLVKSGMTATHTWKYAQGTGSLTPTAVGAWNTPQNTTIRVFINQNSGTASSGVGYWYTSNPTAVISVECDGVTDTLTLVELAEGSDAITAVLSNESHSVPTDQDGNNGVYAGASSTLTIYRGITDESASWSVSQTRSNVTVSEGTTSRTATVTAMSQDVGYVDFVATRTGFSSLTKRFSLSKNKKGASGSRGSGIYSGTVANSSWPSDATANVFVPNGVPVIFDLLTLTFNSGAGPVESRRWNGSAWQTAQNSLSGGLFVDGGIVADKLGAGSITSAVITLAGSGGVIRSSTFTLGNPGAGIPPQGFRISGDGNAFFYGSAVAGSARSTNWNGTINGTTGQPTAGTGTQGWCIDTVGNAEFNTVIVRSGKNIGNNSIIKVLTFQDTARKPTSGNLSGSGSVTWSNFGLPFTFLGQSGQSRMLLFNLDMETSTRATRIKMDLTFSNGATYGGDFWYKNGADMSARAYSGTIAIPSTPTATSISSITITASYAFLANESGSMSDVRLTISEVLG